MIKFDRENKVNENNLNFEKLNATLANPDFANWYYNKVSNNSQEDMEFNIDNFIQIINDYKLN